MARILPFRGITYNKKKIKDYGLVLAQPYDKIDKPLQSVYYRKHKYNVVRIIKGKARAGDRPAHNKYTRAAEYRDNWLNQGILIQDKKPTIYAYYQDYEIDGLARTRKGFIALGRLAEFGKGGVHAHERTLLAPKQDRLKLMRATGGTAGQVFMLYSDPKLVINQLLDKMVMRKKPDITARDEYGVVHKVWKIQSSGLIKVISRAMAPKDVFIADGHHRYETALNYRREMKSRRLRCIGHDSYDNRMMTFINMDDSGLTILPTHRMIYGLKDFSFADMEKRLQKYFVIKEFPFERAEYEADIRATFLAHVRGLSPFNPCFGLVVKGLKKYFLLGLIDGDIMSQIIKDKHSAVWKSLDVTILHSLVLDKMLGIGPKQLEREQNVCYTRYQDEAIKSVRSGKYQIAFLLNPTKVSEVKQVAGQGERMPQKSTDFYPKLLSGLVISQINFAV